MRKKKAEKLAEELAEEKKLAVFRDAMIQQNEEKALNYAFVVDSDFEEDSDFASSDEEGEMSLYQFKGVEYGLDEGDLYLYNEVDGEWVQFGILHEDGTVEEL